MNLQDAYQLEQYWNEKHPQQKVIYSGRAIPEVELKNHILDGVQIDVRNMITAPDAILQQIIEENNLKAESHDETVLRIQKWVVMNLKYVSDDAVEGVSEYWQFPFETLATGTGDCEDGAILIASLAINADVPTFRIRVTAGMVQEAPTAPLGGHGYCTYLRESDNTHVVIDWCYLEDSSVITEHKIPMKDNPYYKSVWFSFNHIMSWGTDSYEIDGRIKSKK